MKTMSQITVTCRECAGRVRRVIDRLHRDDRGAEGLEKLLIVAVIVLPLLGLLILFRDRINGWVNDEWSDVIDTDDSNPIVDPANPVGGGGNP